MRDVKSLSPQYRRRIRALEKEVVTKQDCVTVVQEAAQILTCSQYVHYRALGRRLHGVAEYLKAYLEL